MTNDHTPPRYWPLLIELLNGCDIENSISTYIIISLKRWAMTNTYLGERVRAALTRHPVTISKRVDLYLSEHLPDLMDEYKLATKNDLKDLDKRFEMYDEDVADLDSWRDTTIKKTGELEGRIERLEFKYGIGR